MKRFATVFLIIFALTAIASAQKSITIYDPVAAANSVNTEVIVPESIQKMIESEVFPKAKKHWKDYDCTGTFEPAGMVSGSFTKPNSNQTVVFYSYCQTGNGLGNDGVVLIENDKIIGSFVAESGWTLSLRKLPDVFKNGLDEIALEYGGGTHQGSGGSGIDIMEFRGGKLVGLGWFLAETFGEDQGEYSYLVKAVTGVKPKFTVTKMEQKGNKWKVVTKAKPLTLKKIDSGYTALK